MTGYFSKLILRVLHQCNAGKKAAAKPADPEASHPKRTRQQASRAGSLRGVGGSGQTDTRVANGNPSKT
jgi:hypothetical protein